MPPRPDPLPATAPDGARAAAGSTEDAFVAALAGRSVRPLWVGRRGVDLSRPKAPTVPALWRYGDMRPDLMTAGGLISAEEAFRRVLVLENPAYPGEMRATNTLYAGLQLVLPDEIAPCHRHSQTAFRFVVEGERAWTSVDGERTWLHPGDFVITPNWSWHDHGNRGDGPVVWLDVLDTPLVDLLDTVFRETHAERLQPITAADGASPALYGANMRPAGARDGGRASPVFSYPYARSRPALARLLAAGDPDPCHGIRMQFVDPTSGGPATPSMAAGLQLLPAGFRGAPYRATDGAVYCVAEGTGRTAFDDGGFEWGPGDVFVVPGWHRHRHDADTEAVLFSASDRPVQQKLNLWREERGDG